MADEKVTLDVSITNITPAQAKAFEHLFAGMHLLGSWGCTRQLILDCDGDGGFRPDILVKTDAGTTAREPKLDPNRNFDTRTMKHISIGMNW